MDIMSSTVEGRVAVEFNLIYDLTQMTLRIDRVLLIFNQSAKLLNWHSIFFQI